MPDIYWLEFIHATGALLAAFLAGFALLYSMYAYTDSLKISHYNELDKTYQTLLHIAMQHTYFMKPNEINEKEQQEKYDVYAFMMWNFLEAIYDKCLSDKHLRDTWEPIIEVEGALHSSWFLREDNKAKFKDAFYAYVIKLLAANKPELLIEKK